MTYDQHLSLGYRYIIDGHAKDCVDKVVRKIIRMLQKCKRDSNMMLSEADSGLDNLWDEICVQVQGEHSFFFDVYKNTIFLFTDHTLKECCNPNEIQMIWLQTDAFDNWSNCELESEGELGFHFDKNNFPIEYDIEDVVAYIVEEVLYAAGNYHNRRIENYLT